MRSPDDRQEPYGGTRRREPRLGLQCPTSPAVPPDVPAPYRHMLLVLMLMALVHCPSGSVVAAQKATTSAASQPRSDAQIVIRDTGQLPVPVAEMRDAILAAVRSGRAEELRGPIEWNELPPAFAEDKVGDPIAHLKKLSADGEGREMLAIIANILSLGYAKLPIGRDVENADVYVWPYLAERQLAALTPPEEVDLLRLMPAAEAKAMREKGKWTWYRLVIGADGTWHSFFKHDAP